MASTTFDLPEPFGPTTQVIPGSSLNVVAEAKDLNPFTVRLLRCTVSILARRLAGLCELEGLGPAQTSAKRTRGQDATHPLRWEALPSSAPFADAAVTDKQMRAVTM